VDHGGNRHARPLQRAKRGPRLCQQRGLPRETFEARCPELSIWMSTLRRWVDPHGRKIVSAAGQLYGRIRTRGFQRKFRVVVPPIHPLPQGFPWRNDTFYGPSRDPDTSRCLRYLRVKIAMTRSCPLASCPDNPLNFGSGGRPLLDPSTPWETWTTSNECGPG